MSRAQFITWKEEPLSPFSNEEVLWLSDDTFYQTSEPESSVKLEDDVDFVPGESKSEVVSLLLENLESLIDLDELIKEEPFLLDEKMLPILDDVEPPSCQPVKVEYPLRPHDTQFLLKEFETVYDAIGSLTPPQSPPSNQKILVTLEPLLTTAPPVVYQPQQQVEYPPAVETPQPDIEHELRVVDELVRTRVEDMQWSSPSSPNSNSSGSSNFGDCSSDDPEWIPEPVENCEDALKGKKRAKPYSRSSGVDKKSRKKEQNKNAATRYRMKKKAEVEVILTEEKELSGKNEDLENQIKDMQREIKYLKGLMRDLFKAKGLIN